MIQWQRLETLRPRTEWLILSHSLGDDEIFALEINYTIYPYGQILIAQAYDFPYLLYDVQAIYPQKERFLINFAIPDQLKAQASYDRRFAYKFSSRSFDFEDNLTLTLFKLAS